MDRNGSSTALLSFIIEIAYLLMFGIRTGRANDFLEYCGITHRERGLEDSSICINDPRHAMYFNRIPTLKAMPHSIAILCTKAPNRKSLVRVKLCQNLPNCKYCLFIVIKLTGCRRMKVMWGAGLSRIACTVAVKK